MSAFNLAGTTQVRPNEQRRPSELTLSQAGFTPGQIAQLRALRDVYPMIEWVDSRHDWAMMLFLKWRYAAGLVDESDTAAA